MWVLLIMVTWAAPVTLFVCPLDSSGVEEVEASDVKVHDAQENRATIEEQVEEVDVSAVIVRLVGGRGLWGV